MKVLHLTTHFDIGGITKAIINLAQGLQDKGIEVSIASSGGDAEHLLKNIKHIRLLERTKSELSWKTFKGSYQLYRFLKNSGVDVVHTHTRVTHMMMWWNQFFNDLPWVTTIHGFFKNHSGRKILPLWGDYTIGISPAVIEDLKKQFLKTDHVLCIPHGVFMNSNLTKMDKKFYRTQLGLPQDQVLIGCISRLSPVKGQDILLKALEGIHLPFPFPWKLILVGDGPDHKKLQEMSRTPELDGKVIFAGAVADPTSYYYALDLYVAPSLEEGLGLSILEAMACKLPVIASDIGGIRNIICDNIEGKLFPVGDIIGLRKCIEVFLNDTDSFHQMVDNAYKKVQKEFSWDMMISKHIALYQTLCKEKRHVIHA